MKGFYFLLFTISFLIMIQNMRKLRLRYVKPLAQLIQSGSGILKTVPAPTTSTTSTTSTSSSVSRPTTTTTKATTSTLKAAISTPKAAISTNKAATSTNKAATSTNKAATSNHKKIKAGAPALSGLGSGSVLIFLTNILIQLLHLS